MFLRTVVAMRAMLGLLLLLLLLVLALLGHSISHQLLKRHIVTLLLGVAFGLGFMLVHVKQGGGVSFCIMIP